MTNGVKPTQKQIEGKRREKRQNNHIERNKVKFPIVNMSKSDAIQIIIVFILAMVIGTAIGYL